MTKVTITLAVTIEVVTIEKQPTQEFLKEDFTSFIPYLKEKLVHSIADSWQYNAKVQSVKVKSL